jgi:hypothetical protein
MRRSLAAAALAKRAGTDASGKRCTIMPNTLRPLVFSCPRTGIPVISGILCKPGQSDILEHIALNGFCPVCGEAHQVVPKLCSGVQPREARPTMP